MSKLFPKAAAIVAATAAAGFSGAVVAGAADSASSSRSSATAQRPAGGSGESETALTGVTREKVEAAASAEVKGTVIRTETDRGGVYESHIRRSDGTEVEVKVNQDSDVTSVEDAPAGARAGHGGHGRKRADLAAVADDLGVNQASLRGAVEAARPNRPADGGRSDRGDHEGEHRERAAAMYAAIAEALGKDAGAVRHAFEADRPGRPNR